MKGRLSGDKRTRLKRLLNMMYRPSEIASEVGFGRRQFYKVYIPEGCPHERDGRGHIWINGKEFRDWYIIRYPKMKLGAGEAFCLTGRKPVEMIDPIKHDNDGLKYFVCFCPDCGRKLSRIYDKVG